MSTDELGAFKAVGFKLNPNVCNFFFFLICTLNAISGANFYFARVKRSSRWQLHRKIRCEISVLKLLLIGALKANMETQGKI